MGASIVPPAWFLVLAEVETQPKRSLPEPKRPPQTREEPERSPAQGDSPGTDKTKRDFDASCSREGCHAGLKKTRWVHGPVAVNACDLCHRADGKPEDHRFVFAREKDKLCIACHPPPPKKVVAHKPYADSDCSSCHNPHGGPTNDYLRGGDIVRLCESCHEPKKAAFSHVPVKEGDCLGCHAPHQSDHARLLVREEKQICFKCHGDYKELLEKSVHVHAPLEEGCGSCHFSHGGPHPALLCSEPRDLCARCHEEVFQGFTAAESSHGVAIDKEWCTPCHAPHATNTAKLLLAPGGELCLRCHSEDVPSGDGKVLHSIEKEIENAKYLHGSVAQRECQGCHHAHSSPYPDLLRGPYPKSTYAEFSETTYDLCFACHDRRLVLEERTTVTAFRDGDRNLHYLHVNRKKGRACGVCHEPHGSQRPSLMREKVSFGPIDWTLPINFKATDSGGTCASGCHQGLAYDNTLTVSEDKSPVEPPAAVDENDAAGGP